ncbi:MAG: T9SS type A sorting domain-containing protein [candidate division Zixibacteria bacterium]|nr:T9SS type A sorting domain-containing protein [candidate division Zixibacteria bacterium]
MKNKIGNLVLTSLLILFLTPLTIAEVNKISIEKAQKMETIPDPGFNSCLDYQPVIPFNKNDISDSPGLFLGTTYYDYQTNCSTGSRIAKDRYNGIHVCWMKGNEDWSRDRWIYYNYIDTDRNLRFGFGTPVSEVQSAGYCQIDLMNCQAAAIAYHNARNLYITGAIDAGPGVGNFTLYDLPDRIPDEERFYWPYFTVDINNHIHVVCTENEPAAGDLQVTGYVYHDEDTIRVIDSTFSISTIVVSSRVSDNVAIVYSKPRNIEDEDRFDNDIVIIKDHHKNESHHFNIINITNYQSNDTIRSYGDIDALYDFDGNLHIIWNTPGYWVGNGETTTDACFLWHWSENTGINLVANGWWPSIPGIWSRSIAKMSIGVDIDNNLFALWTQFNNQDVSADGFSNGDLYYNYSSDGGITWSESVNITNTNSDGCLPGDCYSEHWSSLDEIVDDSLYLCYIEDKDAGGIPLREGTATENPVRYLAVPRPAELPLIAVEMIPESKPVTIPAGDFFTYTGIIHSRSIETHIVDVFIFVDIPGVGRYGPIAHYEGIQINSNQTITIPGIIQNVPDWAPIGIYKYIAICGESLDNPIDSTSFDFIIDPPMIDGVRNWSISGWSHRITEKDISLSISSENHPNPFNSSTTIKYILRTPSIVRLEVYNLLGQNIETLVDEYQTAGHKSVTWDASSYSSGIYFYKLTAGDKTYTKRMTLLK